MTGPSAFDQKHIAATTANRRDILEELNLPPQVISFLRRNGKILKWSALVLALLVVAYVVFDNYTEKQRNASTALLAQAMQESAIEQRRPLLEQVIAEYPRTEAALWGQLELAHTAYNAEDYQTAITGYQKVLAEVDDDSPLLPLVRYSLGQAYESSRNFEAALDVYQELSENPSFKNPALLAMGRLYELQDLPERAAEMYGRIDLETNSPLVDQEYVAARLQALKQSSASLKEDPAAKTKAE